MYIISYYIYYTGFSGAMQLNDLAGNLFKVWQTDRRENMAFVDRHNFKL